jgi:transcriptional regulator with XRE-family HTH domain
MANVVAHPIDLNIFEKLKDRSYRRKFFLAETSADIAAQLIALRKRRDLNQHDVAKLIGTQQPAISRIEKSDYQSWSFGILRKIADALDARIRVVIEASEDVLEEYDHAESSQHSAIRSEPSLVSALRIVETAIDVDPPVWLINGSVAPNNIQMESYEGLVSANRDQYGLMNLGLAVDNSVAINALGVGATTPEVYENA